MSGPPNAADTGTIPAHVASKLYRHTFWCGLTQEGGSDVRVPLR